VRAWIALFLCLACTAQAAPESSLRPVERPAAQQIERPSAGQTEPVAATLAASGLAVSLRPEKRPRRVERAGRQAAKLRARGAICDDPEIQGDVIGRVESRISGCGVPQAVGVRSVAGISLSRRATMDCPTARALKTWVEEAAIPAFADRGGGLASLTVAAHYICKTRNSRPGARISEHGKGKAIDISAFQMRNGSAVTVGKGWRAPATRQVMREVHAEACGPFGTVLGPNADRFHQNHFHFDTARHRGGPYCR